MGTIDSEYSIDNILQKVIENKIAEENRKKNITNNLVDIKTTSLIETINIISNSDIEDKSEIYSKYQQFFHIFILKYDFENLLCREIDVVKNDKIIIDTILKYEPDEILRKKFCTNFYVVAMGILQHLNFNEYISSDFLKRTLLFLDSSRKLKDLDDKIYFKIYEVFLKRFSEKKNKTFDIVKEVIESLPLEFAIKNEKQNMLISKFYDNIKNIFTKSECDYLMYIMYKKNSEINNLGYENYNQKQKK